MTRYEPSPMDVRHLAAIRANVDAFLQHAAATYVTGNTRLLDIAPQIHSGINPYLSDDVIVDTLDIDPNASVTYIADITHDNSALIPGGSYSYVVCTEVLEHTLNPFAAAKELHRLLKDGGILFISVPFNFRIHGPLPDCWRFTEHGLRALLSDFEILELNAVETEDRPLMPVHYTVVAKKASHLPG